MSRHSLRRSAAKAVFVSSAALAIFCGAGLTAALMAGGGLDGSFAALFRLGPPLLLALPLVLPGLFSAYAKPLPGPPRILHLALYAIGLLAHVAFAVVVWWLAFGNGLPDYGEAFFVVATFMAIACCWIALFPARLDGKRQPC